MSDVLSKLAVRTKIDPSTPRDVLVSYVTDTIANMLHSCAQQGLDPFGGKKPKGGWEGIELDPKHELDYYLSHVILLVNELDRNDLIDLVSRCHELAMANPLDPDNATSLLHVCFAANYLTATYCAENGEAFNMPEPYAGSFYEPSPSTDANSYRYRMAFCGTVQALKTLMQLLEDENLGLGTMLGNYKILETTLNDTTRCLTLVGCAPTDLCDAMQDKGMLTVLSERLKLIIEYRAESVDHQWEVHGFARGGTVFELTKTPRYYYEFNESAAYDDYARFHTNKKMAKHVWKPRKKTEEQFRAACKNHEVEMLGQFESPLIYDDVKTLSYDILSTVVGDLTLRDVYVFMATSVTGFILPNLDDDGRLNAGVPMSQDWDYTCSMRLLILSARRWPTMTVSSAPAHFAGSTFLSKYSMQATTSGLSSSARLSNRERNSSREWMTKSSDSPRSTRSLAAMSKWRVWSDTSILSPAT